jgi:hypothetical protein
MPPHEAQPLPEDEMSHTENEWRGFVAGFIWGFAVAAILTGILVNM